ncbi:CRTAC1 family protein [Synoicihabitans lomoniglobus]|uniref:CRTAC1 family protein n=1 Tax=Synoicihabitans lomoniglobus TaxID=2909285 RepID=A0AAF0CRJ1_9BACT|nr:CRTAC1 family protein [Opitutaceae bacterium LMO-M01]WED66723.1 CRTAC1 family protein [Opitutaceae bacterium LMO-M01]
MITGCLTLSAAQPESTRRMVERLANLDIQLDGATTQFFPHIAVPLLEKQLAEAVSDRDRFPLMMPYAQALLNDGQSEAALAQIEEFGSMIGRSGVSLPREQIIQLLELKALTELRIGEQTNCLLHHNADSCLLPLQGGGIHQDQAGSRAAISTLNQILNMAPSPYSAWLLNIAHMTVGEYPQNVPSRWAIPERVFASDYDIKRFPDIAGSLGLAVDDLSGGLVMEDFDRDGWLDLMVSAWGFDGQLRYFHNNGDGSFTELTDTAGLTGLFGGLNMIHGDIDNDGFMDVLVLRGAWLAKDGRFPNSLLRNNGDNTFTDVTEAAGLLEGHSTQTATWFDFNGDGWLDIFIGNESVPGDPEFDACQLFRNNQDGTFTDIAATSGVAIVDWVKGVTSGDFNNDGRPDLYVSSLTGPNRLLRNDGPASPGDLKSDWIFTDVTKTAGVADPQKSFPCWFFDYNNDGWLDLFVTGYSIRNAGDILADLLGSKTAGERARLYRNNGDGTFTDASAEAGLDQILHMMGGNFGDLDNDGWLDFYVGTGDPHLGTIIPNRMFRGHDGTGFQDVTTSGGFGQLQKGHAIAFGDLNHDGAQDVYAVVGGAFSGDHYPNQLFANPGHGNHWIKLQLEGVQSNRPGVGSRIKVVVQTPSVERAIHRVVSSGGSFGATSFRQEIGLGDATAVKRVEIFWPTTGKTQVFTGLALDQEFVIREGSGTPREVSRGSFPWPTGDAAAAHMHHH